MVSIIIPSHNYGAYIGDALRSVASQSYPHWECIVVDDASTDDTHLVVGAFCDRDKRFKYIRLTHNVGVSEARNVGFRQAKGEFIQLLDADDQIAAEKIELQVQYLKSNPKTDIVYSDFFHFTTIPDFSVKGEYLASEKLSGSGNSIVARLLKGNIFRLNTIMFRTEAIRRYGMFRKDLRSVEDYEFWLRLACADCRFHFLDEPRALSAVRINPAGLSRDIPGMKKNYLPALQSIRANWSMSIPNSVRIWMRYVFVFLDKLLFTREEIRFLPERKVLFMILLFFWSIFALPFFLIYKLIRRLR